MSLRLLLAAAVLGLVVAPASATAAPAPAPKVLAVTAFLGPAEGLDDVSAVYVVVRTDRPVRRDFDVPDARFDLAGDVERPFTLFARGQLCYRSRHLLSAAGRTRPSKASGLRPARVRPGTALHLRFLIATDLTSETPRTVLDRRIVVHRERAGDRAGRTIGCPRPAHG